MNAFAAGALKHRHERLLKASRLAYITLVSSLRQVLHPSEVHDYLSVRNLREAIAAADGPELADAIEHDLAILTQQRATTTCLGRGCLNSVVSDGPSRYCAQHERRAVAS